MFGISQSDAATPTSTLAVQEPAAPGRAAALCFAPDDRRAERHSLSRGASARSAERARVDGHGLLVHQPVRRLRVRLYVLLRALCTPLRAGSCAESAAPRTIRCARRSSPFRRGSRSSGTCSSRKTQPAILGHELRPGGSRLAALDCWRGRRGRDRDRPIPTGGASFSRDARCAGDPRRARRAFCRRHHEESAHHPRCRTCCGVSPTARR